MAIKQTLHTEIACDKCGETIVLEARPADDGITLEARRAELLRGTRQNPDIGEKGEALCELCQWKPWKKDRGGAT